MPDLVPESFSNSKNKGFTQMKKLLLILSLISSFSIFAFSQTEEYDKGEFFAGYSSNSDLLDDSIPPVEHGFNVAGVYNVRQYVGIKVDVSGTYRPLRGSSYYQQNTQSAAAGVQFKDNRKDSRLKPFGHILVGYGRNQYKFTCGAGSPCSVYDADTEGVSLVLGGGLDIKINRRIDIRALQLDINPIISTANRYGNYWNGRFSAGVILKF